MFLQIVLRGISGVGKTTLRRLLTTAFLAKGYKVIVESKDQIRQEVARSRDMPYTYSEDEERMVSWIYKSRIHALLHPFQPNGPFANAILICDNTHVNLNQLQESEFCLNPQASIPTTPYKRALIEVGTFDSVSSKSNRFPKIIQRQRVQLVDSAVPLHNWCQIHFVPQYWIQDHSAIEDGVLELVNDLLNVKNKE